VRMIGGRLMFSSENRIPDMAVAGPVSAGQELSRLLSAPP
jgi:hypothetical protein